MQIVVEIDDNLYTRLFDNGVDNYDDAVDMAKAIRKGTPLPKGHGRIGDLDALREEVSSWGMNDYEPSDFIDVINEADTIIEADKDKEYEAKVITRGNCMMCGKELTEGLFLCKECKAKATQGRK